MDQEFKDAFAALGAKIDALGSAQNVATVTGGGEVPPGFVAVRPTGPQGAGKVRLWPAVVEGEMAWGYAQRVEKMIDPLTSMPYYYPAGRYVIIGPAQSAWGGTLPETLDRLMHPHDWMTQQELDMEAALKQRDLEGADGFGGH